MRSRDDGIAAVAALHGVTELASKAAADRLVALVGDGDTVFRLAAGRALRAVGDDRGDRFSFDALPGCEVRLWRNGHLRAFARVDGREVGVVLVGPMFWARGFGRTNSRNYVYWVHTDESFRRLGIARRLFDAALEASPWTRSCSEVALHAMTDYFAHALYRDRGLVNTRGFLTFSKDVQPATRRAPRGIRIRSAGPEDVRPASELARRTHEVRGHPDVPSFLFRGDEIACIAEEGRTIRGLAVWRGTMLFEFAVDAEIEDAGRREAIALALLAHGERRFAAAGEKELTAMTHWRYDDPTHVRWLHRAGYSSKTSPLVEQARIVRLGRYLTEIEGVLEARLAAAKLPRRRVAVGIDGGTRGLRATLRIDGTRVRVSAGLRGRAGVTVRGGAESVQAVVLGATSPFREWNQRRVDVLPTPNGETKRLLEALFPDPTL
jgi:GNAT superfamily N-acetyltransferase